MFKGEKGMSQFGGYNHTLNHLIDQVRIVSKDENGVDLDVELSLLEHAKECMEQRIEEVKKEKKEERILLEDFALRVMAGQIPYL